MCLDVGDELPFGPFQCHYRRHFRCPMTNIHCCHLNQNHYRSMQYLIHLISSWLRFGNFIHHLFNRNLEHIYFLRQNQVFIHRFEISIKAEKMWKFSPLALSSSLLTTTTSESDSSSEEIISRFFGCFELELEPRFLLRLDDLSFFCVFSVLFEPANRRLGAGNCFFTRLSKTALNYAKDRKPKKCDSKTKPNGKKNSIQWG